MTIFHIFTLFVVGILSTSGKCECTSNFCFLIMAQFGLYHVVLSTCGGILLRLCVELLRLCVR